LTRGAEPDSCNGVNCRSNNQLLLLEALLLCSVAVGF